MAKEKAAVPSFSEAYGLAVMGWLEEPCVGVGAWSVTSRPITAHQTEL